MSALKRVASGNTTFSSLFLLSLFSLFLLSLLLLSFLLFSLLLLSFLLFSLLLLSLFLLSLLLLSFLLFSLLLLSFLLFSLLLLSLFLLSLLLFSLLLRTFQFILLESVDTGERMTQGWETFTWQGTYLACFRTFLLCICHPARLGTVKAREHDFVGCLLESSQQLISLSLQFVGASSTLCFWTLLKLLLPVQGSEWSNPHPHGWLLHSLVLQSLLCSPVRMKKGWQRTPLCPSSVLLLKAKHKLVRTTKVDGKCTVSPGPASLASYPGSSLAWVRG